MRTKLTMILVLLLSLLMMVGNSLAASFTLGVGKKGNTYDRVVGGNLALQLNGSDIDFEKENFAGSKKIIAAIKAGDIDGGVVQMNALIGEDFPFQVMARTHKEYVHMIAKYKGKVKKVGDLLGGTLAVGRNGGGTKLTWNDFCALDEKYKKKVATQPKDGSMALADLESGKIDALMYVGGLRSKDMMRANKKKKTFWMVKINDSQFNNLEVNGEKVYDFEKIDDDVYPNLIGGSSIKTLYTYAVIVVSQEWVDENPDAFDTLYDAVSDALPNIQKALVND